MSRADENRQKLWGPHAQRFIGVPFQLLVNYRAMGLSEVDFIIVCWIIFHQWDERATFAHPDGLAKVLGLNHDQTVRRLKSLERRGLLVLEQTKRNKTNYYQDLRPLRNKLREITEINDAGIDTSINSSSLTNTSVLDAEVIDPDLKDINTPDSSRRQNSKNGPTQIGEILTESQKEWWEL